jgi:type I restriction enzyme, S subunit
VKGQAPHQWTTRRLKRAVDLINDRAAADTSSYIGLEHVEPWTGRLLNSPVEAEPAGSTSRFQPGDILFGKLRPYLAKVVHATFRGRCSPELLVLRPRAHDSRYLQYVLLTDEFIRRVDATTYGSKMPRANWTDIGAFVIPVPPLTDQRAIADYLDEKTAAIDALIAKKERLIDLIEEKRQAAITRAVTKGLDPDVQMKDSGVEWLGEAPAHWEVLRLKQAITYITSGSRGWAEYYSDTGSVFLRIGNLKRGSLELDLSDVQYVTPPAGSEGERTRVQEGDVLFSITAYIGSVGIAEPGLAESYVSQHIALVRPNLMRVDPKWLGYTFLSDPGQASLRYPVYGGTKEGLGLDDVKSLPLLIPPLSEQKRILSFLAPTEQQTGATRESLRTQIQKLLEYRQTLISAAVTGQIDVHSRGARAVELLEEATV